MHINIDLKQSNEQLPPVKFKFLLKELEHAITECYLGMGTPYNPMPVDNFVITKKKDFSEIKEETDISISLDTSADNNLTSINDFKLVCCKVKNVGKKFNNQNDLPNDHWKKVFTYRDGLIYSAPDGTLYISPDEHGICSISTDKNSYEEHVSYSILISLNLDLENGYSQRFYIVIDPLVKITSGGGTNS